MKFFENNAKQIIEMKQDFTDLFNKYQIIFDLILNSFHKSLIGR